MLEPLVVKATRAVPRRERGSNPPDLSNFRVVNKVQFSIIFLILISFLLKFLSHNSKYIKLKNDSI